ncbi:MAG: aminotransferase class III-fold pyridoxal phosphate-dependent enzyme, partial [Ilumatobacter sp.]
MVETGAHLSNVWSKATDLRIERGVGCRVIDVNGVEYLDFTAGIAAASTGHSHPKVTQAIADQAARMIHSQINVYRHDKLEPLAAKLAEITPEPIDTFYFGSTSDEILEAAVKLAKHATDRRNVVVFDGAFHGRTHYGLAMSSSRAIDRDGYGPLPGGVFIAPFPEPHASDQEAEVSRALRGLDRLLSTQVSASKVAAIVIEPVIGERGYIPTPKAFVAGIAERCAEHGILLVADETQSGFGRTGKMFAT